MPTTTTDDRETLDRIAIRWITREVLNDPAQICLDVGYLLGMCHRLQAEVNELRALAIEFIREECGDDL